MFIIRLVIGYYEINGVYLFRGFFRPHPTSSICAVSQYRKRFPSYYPEINAIIPERDHSGYDNTNSILDENDMPMEHGEVAWDTNDTTIAIPVLPRVLPRIPAVYLWSPMFSYRLFSNRNSTELNKMQYTMMGTFRPYTGMTHYEDSEHPYWEEPLQIVFLFI